MARHKANSPPWRLILRDLLFRLTAGAAIIFLLALILVSCGRSIRNSDFFKIEDIIIKGKQNLDLSYLKGRNIFSLAIARESAELAEVYPDFKFVRIVRVLPNRLFVDFISRKPVALVKLYRYFCVDEEAVLFDLPREEAPDLPLILGLETKIFGPKSGRKYNLKELNLALEAVGEFKKSRALKDYKITTVNAAKAASLSLSITPGQVKGIEIKIGEDDLGARLNILANLLFQEKKAVGKIKYIDLRFKEPVIKYNDAQ